MTFMACLDGQVVYSCQIWLFLVDIMKYVMKFGRSCGKWLTCLMSHIQVLDAELTPAHFPSPLWLCKESHLLQCPFQVLPVSRSISPISQRLFGDSGRTTSFYWTFFFFSAELFRCLYLTPPLIPPLKETSTMRESMLRNLFNSSTYFPAIFCTTRVMLFHYGPRADDCQACASCFRGLVWVVCSLCLRWII